MKPTSLSRALLLLLAAVMLGACDRSSSSSASGVAPPAPQAQSKPPVELTFAYGSEKEKWVNEVTVRFNNSGATTASGRAIKVKAVPLGSGELVDEVLAGRLKAHLISPASGVFVKLGNAQSRAATGQDLVGSTDNLVLSPVVLAMWKPMADVLAKDGKGIGWSDILRLAADPSGWASLGHPEWGAFKFGHTHPEYSNSGVISILAEVYAASGKVNNLSLDDVSKPEVAKFVKQIESAVVHYGSSTGFFGRKMFAGGTQYLSAAVLYENMVIESYDPSQKLAVPMVAVYPREGTFWSDHPVGVVQREWVGADEQEAAKAYIKFLLAGPQQHDAMRYGFRPGDPSMALEAPFDAAHGVDARQPLTTLEVPSPEVVNAVIKVWRENKKHADVVLALDISGSMNEQAKLLNAKKGAAELLKMMADQDRLALLTFNGELRWAQQSVGLAQGRGALSSAIDGLIANGDTRLYDAIIESCKSFGQTRPAEARITAVVVLTDGQDTKSVQKLPAVLQLIRPREDGTTLRVFTIGYGDGANKQVLGQISDQTGAKSFDGTPENIREVFKEIATFF